MPRKYIHVSQLYAKCPFARCQLHFIVKRRERQVAHQMDVTSKILNLAINEYLQFEYGGELRDELALYLVVVSAENRVVSIGHIPLYLGEQLQDKKQYVKGVAKQNGFIVYSTRDAPFSLQIASEAGRSRDESLGRLQLKAVSENNSNGNQITKSKAELNGSFEEKHYSVECKSIEQAKYGSQAKLYESQAAFTPSKMLNLEIKSEGEGKGDEPKSSKGMGHSEKKYSKARAKLDSHKSRNNSYRGELAELRHEFERQQEKLRLLGLVDQV